MVEGIDTDEVYMSDERIDLLKSHLRKGGLQKMKFL